MEASEDKELKKQLQTVYTVASFGKRFLSPLDISQIEKILDDMGYRRDIEKTYNVLVGGR